MTPAASTWTDLGGGVRVRQSRVYWMNTVLLADREHTLVIDPGVLPSELDELAREVDTIRPATVTLVFTHGDWDHVLGRPWWPKARTVAHDAFAADVAAHEARIREEAEKAAAGAGERWTRGFQRFAPDEAVSGLRFTKIGPWRIVLRDAFGHSPSMLSLHLPERGVLIAADMLSDLEIPMIDHDGSAYVETLAALLPLAQHGAIETLIPGHGAVARGRDAILERIERDLDYLESLRSGVDAARAQGLSLEAARERLEAMDYLGKAAEYSMVDVHRRNVERLWSEPPRRSDAPHVNGLGPRPPAR